MAIKKIAALQLGSDPQGTQKTLDNILGYEQQILDTKCQLLVMPEALLGGYPKGADFGARIGYRTPLGRKEYLAYWQQAIELDGPEVDQLCQLAQRAETMFIFILLNASGS